jgi:hypothetical protein
MLLSFPAYSQTTNTQGTAQITSVGPISPKAWQTIVIKGAHFGINPPINGCPDHLRVTDVTTNWSVPFVGPFGGCQAGIFVSSWNDNEIVIEGFPSFQRGHDAFKIGDVIKIEVSNAQRGGPAAWYSLRVGAAGIRQPPLSPRVPVSTQNSPSAVQTAARDDSKGATATFEDDFTSDHFLNQSIWSTRGEALNARILKADTKFVPVRLAFSSLGMSMAGVQGAYQSTGIQSVRSFSTPLTLEAKVMGTIANGNPFALYLVSADGGQFLTLNGHLDRGDGRPFSLALGYTGLGGDAGNAARRELSRAGSLRATNVIRITVDPRGVGTVVVEDLQGSRLAAENNLTVGTGPFFVVLAQWEGWPRAAGPNEAVWGRVTISAASPEAVSAMPGSASVSNPAPSNPSQLPLPATVSNGGASVRGAIRSVDFLNLDYPSDCWEQFEGFGKVIHVSNGEWRKEDVGSFGIRNQAPGRMMTYGDLEGDGREEAVIVTSCRGQTNFDYAEIFVFAESSAGPKLLARLSPSDWGRGQEDNGGDFPVTGVHVSKQQLAVSFLAGGSHACPAWTVTARFQWNGNRFVRTGLDRSPFKCS